VIPELALDPETATEQAMDDFGPITVFLAAMGGEEGIEEFKSTVGAQVPVHGGVTWAGFLDFGPEAPWGFYIGFDCGHAGDATDPEFVSPELGEFSRKMQREFGYHVWAVEDVALETKRMAAAVLAAYRYSPQREDG
jgi:hypothetical protein